MRLRNISGSQEIIAKSEYVIHDEEAKKGQWKEVFGNNHDIYIEIGMGKGQFILENAIKNKEINYIGIEKYSSVLLRAIQKLEIFKLLNIKYIRMDAEMIEQVFEKNEVSRIYLNFSDPWPKDKHARRRLPSKEFLERYDNILKPDGILEFKTDNRDLFDFAVSELELTNWKLLKITYDLHHDKEMMLENVMTEYEEKFSSKGNPIYKYIIAKKKINKQKEKEE